jgi:pyruvate kinase
VRSTLRRTRIVATVGPASSEPEQLRPLIEAGVDVVRLNASHADAAYFRTMVPRIREIADDLDRTVAVLLDLRGPKIRIGRMERAEGVELIGGSEVEIAPGDFAGTAERLPCTYADLPSDVGAGDVILIDDGLVELEVLTADPPHSIRCRVIVGGTVRANKGINVPGRPLSTPAFGPKDLADLDAALPLGIDFVALSFVRRADDVHALRRELHQRGSVVPIVAKIEKPQAIDALEEILEATDAVMVARGDLGVEVPPERVPRLQKRIIARANARGLPVITATQMLESMMENPRPTRAEASDVANAIFDGTDAVMLSGETAVGRYPLYAVQMMDRIAREAEASQFYGSTGVSEEELEAFELERREVAVAATRIARRIDADSIVVYTLSGTTARLMSKLRPRRPIYALCPDEIVCRRMTLEHGIVPLRVDYYAATDDMLREGDRLLTDLGVVEADDRVVVVGGTRQFAGVSNMIQVRHPVGDATPADGDED